MKKHMNNPIRFWSLVSGIALLIMTFAAAYAYGFSFIKLYVDNDSALTLNNINNNLGLFYSGALMWCLILITDLLVSYGFYRYLKPIHHRLAIASGLLRLIYSLLLAIGIYLLFLKDTNGFLSFWSIGLFIIGFHLIVTGIANLYNKDIHLVFAILLIIAGSGYSLIHGIQNFMPQASQLAATLENILAIPMTLGELSFGIWLLVKGGRPKRINQQPLDVPVQDVP